MKKLFFASFVVALTCQLAFGFWSGTGSGSPADRGGNRPTGTLQLGISSAAERELQLEVTLSNDARNVLLEEGDQAVVVFPAAFNDATGKYCLRVEDVVTDAAAEAEFELE